MFFVVRTETNFRGCGRIKILKCGTPPPLPKKTYLVGLSFFADPGSTKNIAANSLGFGVDVQNDNNIDYVQFCPVCT
jgi:hypothetical protein